MLRTTRGYAAAALGLLLTVAACSNDDLFHPAGLTPIDPLFASYVSMGTTITAGWQSGGINDSMQLQSFVVLLAQQMRTPFFVPLMSRPGCPPPLINVYLQTRVPPAVPNNCAFRKTQPVPPPYINNVAVPGALVVDALDNLDPTGNPTALTTLFLGGLTQFEALRRARPTFVTVELGVTDVLRTILDQSDAGSAADITPPATFDAQFKKLMDSIDAVGSVQGGVLIGVVQVAGVPYVSQGRYYYAAQASFPPGVLAVNTNCLDSLVVGPGDTVRVLVPFHYGAPIIAAAAAGSPQTLDCSVPQVISVNEALNMIGAVIQYNATIKAAADARKNWLYVDPNPALQLLAQDPTAIRPFPAFPPDPNATTAPFGTAVSRDGIHPSAATHKLVANALIQMIGHGLQLVP